MSDELLKDESNCDKENVLYYSRYYPNKWNLYLYANQIITYRVKNNFHPAIKNSFTADGIHNLRLVPVLHIREVTEDNLKFLKTYLKGLDEGFRFIEVE